MIDEFILTQFIPLMRTDIFIFDQNASLRGAIRAKGDADGEAPAYAADVVKRAAKEYPYIEVDDDGVAVCSMWSERDGMFVVLGKVCLYGYYSKNGESFTYCPKEKYTSVILIIWRQMTGMDFGRDELWEKNVDVAEDVLRALMESSIKFQNDEEAVNPYLQELREQDSIRRGDVHGLKESVNNVSAGTVGRMAEDDVRNSKDLAICIISAAARSAIKGGVAPEKAFAMCDAFIREIEENCSDPIKIEREAREAEFGFAKEVRRMDGKAGRSPLVRQVKDYVFEHVRDSLLVRDIAKYVGASPGYLSEQFKRQEGVTLKQYIIDEKIKSSEFLLKHTECSIQEISSAYAFSSQSRFGEYFQRKNGVTPAKYRKNFLEGRNEKNTVKNV